jgi:hypothetical protein
LDLASTVPSAGTSFKASVTIVANSGFDSITSSCCLVLAITVCSLINHNLITLALSSDLFRFLNPSSCCLLSLVKDNSLIFLISTDLDFDLKYFLA